MDAPSPALQAARRLARRASCPILPVDGSLPDDVAGRVLLADAEPSDALLAQLAEALPRAEALVLWVAGWSVDDAAATLGRHGFEHGSINAVDMPAAGVLAVLTSDEARADAHAAALAARERDFRALAVMPAFNEGDVIGPAIGALISEGVDVYLLDHRSTDDTVAQASPWLGRGLVRIERFPDESGDGFDERNGDVMVWRDILRRAEQVTGEVDADWYLFVNADEFRESPWPQTTLSDGLRRVDELGFNAINFELVNFRPTPQDRFVERTDVREALRFYEKPGHYDGVQVKAWKRQLEPVNLHELGGHDVLFEGKRICPVPFVLRHYPIRSAEHGRRKVRGERLARFAAEEREQGWHVQYDHYDDDADYLHERDTLVAWDGDRFRAELLGRTVGELLLVGALTGIDPGATALSGDRVVGWLERRGHGPVGQAELDVAQRHLHSHQPGHPVLEALADDILEATGAHARSGGRIQAMVTFDRLRAMRREAA